MATQVSLTDGAVASAGALAIQTNGTTQAVSISTGQVATLAQNPILTSGTANGVAYLNGSKAVTSGSALTFDGTNFATTGTASATKMIPTGGSATGNGMYLPASNTLAWSNNGSETMRLDSAGNLGLGVTPSAWGGTYKALQFGSYGALETNNSNKYVAVASNHYNNGSGDLYIANGYASRYYQDGAGAHVWNTAASGTAGNAITFTQAMTLDASGNLLVGTSSAVYPSGQSGATIYRSSQPVLRIAEGTSYFDLLTTGDNVYINNRANGFMAFYTNASERARIDSSGNLLVGTTSSFSARLAVKDSTSNGTTNPIVCKNSSDTTLFYISSNGYFVTGTGANSPYNLTTASGANVTIESDGVLKRSTSSLKYKTDVQDATHGLADVLQLRPVTYKGKNDGNKVFGGLIAEEVHEAGLTEFVQYAEDGTPDALAYGNMVSLCIKAIQEQQALITQLTARITALESA